MVAFHSAYADAARLRLSAHTLKASLRYFGLVATYERCCRLEELSAAGKLDEAQAIFSGLEAEMERFVSTLAAYSRQGGAPV